MSQQLTPIPTMTDSELRKELANQTELIELAEAALAIHKAAKHFVQAEIDRRALAAYWDAHPDLLRLEVGDKLLATKEFLDSEHVKEYLQVWRRVAVVYVEMFFFKDGKGRVKNHPEGSYSSVGVPIAIMSNMRQAYLAQQGETT